MNATYIYYYKSDSSKEAVGRVNAENIEDALQQISVIKRLSLNLVDNLFVVECVKGCKDENDI
jgi:hypothetical protein